MKIFNKKIFYLKYYGTVIGVFVIGGLLSYGNEDYSPDFFGMGTSWLIIMLLVVGGYIADILDRHYLDSSSYNSTINDLVSRYGLLEKLEADLKQYDNNNQNGSRWDMERFLLKNTLNECSTAIVKHTEEMMEHERIWRLQDMKADRKKEVRK